MHPVRGDKPRADQRVAFDAIDYGLPAGCT
jgi:hypothetical protein